MSMSQSLIPKMVGYSRRLQSCKTSLIDLLTILFISKKTMVANSKGGGAMAHEPPPNMLLLKAMTTFEFCGISVSLIISKLFEFAIIDKFCYFFITSDFQFGFEKHLSCNHAGYTVRNVVGYYVANSSTVNICLLGLSKVFITSFFQVIMF
jgi:hypothetical protein